MGLSLSPANSFHLQAANSTRLCNPQAYLLFRLCLDRKLLLMMLLTICPIADPVRKRQLQSVCACVCGAIDLNELTMRVLSLFSVFSTEWNLRVETNWSQLDLRTNLNFKSIETYYKYTYIFICKGFNVLFSFENIQNILENSFFLYLYHFISILWRKELEELCVANHTSILLSFISFFLYIKHLFYNILSIYHIILREKDWKIFVLLFLFKF